MKKFIVLAAAALSLSSCGLYTQYKPQSEVEKDLYGEQLSSSKDTTSIANISWREFFTDRQLQTLIDEALKNNTNLLSAQSKVESAQAALRSARLTYLPSLSLQPNATVSGFVESGGKASQSYQLPAVASWEIDIFGRIRNSKLSSQMAYAQSKDYQQAVKTQLVASVANLYYTLLMLDAQLEITQATEKSWQQSVEAAESMKRAGLMNEAGVAQMKSAHLQTQNAVISIKTQIALSQNALCSILSSTPHQIQRGTLAEQQFTQSLAVGVPLQVLSHRPDVRAAEMSLAQAYYSTNIARSALYPSISLSGLVGWTNTATGVVVNPADLIYSVTGSLVQPIFNKGLNRAQLEIAKNSFEQSRLSFQQTLLDAGREVNDAMTSYQASLSKSPIYERQIEELEVARKSTSLLMTHGSTTYLEVLSAKQSLLAARLESVANRVEQIQNLITLYNALGGGRF
ncbi:MAG: efflux transporter outer membrane subunit [Rikenellaceae bacterium]